MVSVLGEISFDRFDTRKQEINQHLLIHRKGGRSGEVEKKALEIRLCIWQETSRGSIDWL